MKGSANNKRLIKKNVFTPPIDQAWLVTMLVMIGIIMLTVSLIFSPSMTAFLSGMGIYTFVVIFSLLVNRFLRKVHREG